MPTSQKTLSSCRIADCIDRVHGKELCNKHYKRMQAHGDPETTLLPRGTPEERFWAKVDADGDCWEWLAFRDRDGYGMFAVTESHSLRAHRFVWETLVGKIGKLTIDHLCRNRGCVNPDHLQPVPNVVNVRRGYGVFVLNARRDACANGHPFDEGNTGLDSAGRRLCRACRTERKRASNTRLKTERNAAGRISNAEKTHCKAGHPFLGDNLVVEGRKRTCVECRRAYARKYYHQRKAAA